MCSHKESIYRANWLLLQSSIFCVCVCRVFINSLVNKTPPLTSCRVYMLQTSQLRMILCLEKLVVTSENYLIEFSHQNMSLKDLHWS